MTLTPRERSILRSYPAHGDYQGMADELGLAIQTIKNHVSDILRKLGCVSLGQAAVLYDRTLRTTWPETDRRGWQRRGPQRRVGERRATIAGPSPVTATASRDNSPQITGYVNPDGSGKGNWSRKA